MRGAQAPPLSVTSLSVAATTLPCVREVLGSATRLTAQHCRASHTHLNLEVFCTS
jgi:hypothetical protein